METIIKVSQNQYELAWGFARELADSVNRAAQQKQILTVALSGGTTPKLLFSILGTHFVDNVRWNAVHFFWGDERCVPMQDPQSNFGMANEVFLGKIGIPAENIHRIVGEADPDKEAIRYSDEVSTVVAHRHNLPSFNLIILGLGDDGHTASIFPGNSGLFASDKICEAVIHPESKQERITITGPIINNAENIIFLVTGRAKASVVAEIIEKPGLEDYPAACVKPKEGVVKWYLDMDAASGLRQWA